MRCKDTQPHKNSRASVVDMTLLVVRVKFIPEMVPMALLREPVLKRRLYRPPRCTHPGQPDQTGDAATK